MWIGYNLLPPSHLKTHQSGSVTSPLTYLPDSYHCISYEDHNDHNRLHKGCGGFFSFLKPGQNLQRGEEGGSREETWRGNLDKHLKKETRWKAAMVEGFVSPKGRTDQNKFQMFFFKEKLLLIISKFVWEDRTSPPTMRRGYLKIYIHTYGAVQYENKLMLPVEEVQLLEFLPAVLLKKRCDFAYSYFWNREMSLYFKSIILNFHMNQTEEVHRRKVSNPLSSPNLKDTFNP